MKRLTAIILTVALLCGLLTVHTAAFDPYTVYKGTEGCRLVTLSFPQSHNPWLLWNVNFETHAGGRVLETTKDHPNLLGQTAVPVFTFEGERVTFNGELLTSGETAVTLLAENELIIYGNGTRAEYQVSITEETNGIPVVLIDTDGAAIPDKVNYVDTAITVLGAEVYGGEDLYAVTGGIKLRGNSTMGYDKKPYRIKFDKKQNVFGLGKAKSWVLLANYLDPASVRNDVAYGFATRLSTLTEEQTGFRMYVPRTRPVEVYLNGEYRGLYDLGDHVQVDETRIAIDESGDEFDDNDIQLFPEGNVGYYLEIEDGSRVIPEWYKENAYYVTIDNTGGTGYGAVYTGQLDENGNAESYQGPFTRLYVQLKTPELPSEEQLDYIQDYLQTVNDLILAQDERVWDYIDMDGFIDWYLVNEMFKNTDSAFLSSIKMFKDKDGKLSMGPVWDFDIGASAVSYNGVSDPTGWLTRSDSRCGWYEALFGMEEFSSAVEARWAALHEAGILGAVFTDIDRLTVYLEEAGKRDYTMWYENYVNAVNNTGWLHVDDRVLYSDQWIEQVQILRAFMQGRIAWMDTQFGYTASAGKVIGGKPSIVGRPEYGYTLTADPVSVTPYGARLNYQWYADGTAISGANRESFTPSVEHIGKEITVKAMGVGSYSGSATSDPLLLERTEYLYKTTQVPPLIRKTDTLIEVSPREGYEISVDGENWQTDGLFTGLEPNTLYRVVYRHGVVEEREGGLAGEPLYVITDPAEPPSLVGDINLNGTVDTMDALLLYGVTGGGRTLTDEQRALADITGDGVINMMDALMLYKTASGQ